MRKLLLAGAVIAAPLLGLQCASAASTPAIVPGLTAAPSVQLVQWGDHWHGWHHHWWHHHWHHGHWVPGHWWAGRWIPPHWSHWA